jgi:hypothetical protein
MHDFFGHRPARGGGKFQYRGPRLQGFRFEMNITEDDIADNDTALGQVLVGASPWGTAGSVDSPSNEGANDADENDVQISGRWMAGRSGFFWKSAQSTNARSTVGRRTRPIRMPGRRRFGSPARNRLRACRPTRLSAPSVRFWTPSAIPVPSATDSFDLSFWNPKPVG